jgi:hypothetical protein
MRSIRILTAVASLSLFSIVGCEPAKESTATPPAGGDSKSGPASVVDGAKSAAAGAAASMVKAEVACAHCVYHVNGVTSCAPAVKVDGQTFVLSGPAADALKGNMDLCKGAKAATVEGKVEGDKFVASKVELQK